jgi:hypothetical protein
VVLFSASPSMAGGNRGLWSLRAVAFMDLVEAVIHSPWVKREWVEFLGEQPDPAVDRVDAEILRRDGRVTLNPVPLPPASDHDACDRRRCG